MLKSLAQRGQRCIAQEIARNHVARSGRTALLSAVGIPAWWPTGERRLH